MATFEAKHDRTREQQLKVQEVAIHESDKQMYVESGGDLIIKIGEEVTKVHLGMVKDNSTNSLVHFDAAAITIVDSTTLTAGGDKKAIKLSPATLDANDVCLVKYETK